MTDARDALLAAHRLKRRRAIVDIWLSKATKEEADTFRELTEAFCAVRQDSGPQSCAYQTLREVVEDRTSLRCTANTLMAWIRRKHPDDPALRD